MTIIPLCILLHLIFYDDTVVVISYVFKYFYNHHHHIQSKYWYNYKLPKLRTGRDNYDNVDSIRIVSNPFLDSLGTNSNSNINSSTDYNINSKNLLQELCQYLFNGSNPFYEWYPYRYNDDDGDSGEKKKKVEEYKYMLRIVFGNGKSINYTHYLITSKEEFKDNIQCMNDSSSSRPPIKTTSSTTTSTLFNSKSSSYSLIPNDDYVLTNANKKIQELIASMNMFNYIKTLKQYEIMVNTWLSLRLNKNNTPRLITKFDLITQQVINKRVAILIDIENVPDFRKYFYIHRNGYISFTSPPVPKLVVAPSIENNVIDDHSVRIIDAGDFTYSRRGSSRNSSGISDLNYKSHLNYNSDQSTSYRINNYDDDDDDEKGIDSAGGNEVMREQHRCIDEDSLQNYLESSTVSHVNYKNIMKRNPYLRNNLEGFNLVDTAVDDNDMSSIRYDDYDEHCDRVLLNSDLNDEDILILAYAHTKSMLSNWANRVTTDSRKNAADSKYHSRITCIYCHIHHLKHCQAYMVFIVQSHQIAHHLITYLLLYTSHISPSIYNG